MKWILSLLAVNILLISIPFIIINNSGLKKEKVTYLPDCQNMDILLAKSYLENYNLQVTYVESDLEEGTVIGSSPQFLSMVYPNQKVELFVSKGFEKKRYNDIVNSSYEDCTSYLKELMEEYNINIVIEYKEDSYLPDGLIYSVELEDKFIDQNDIIVLVVIKNQNNLILADFTGWYYLDVIKYAKENQIIIDFEYVSSAFEDDYVVSQSVNPNSVIIKGSGRVVVYLSKNEW